MGGTVRKTGSNLRMSGVGGEGEWSKKWFDSMARGQSVEMSGVVTRENFHRVINEADVQEAFDDLEIWITDRSELFDILDADGSGAIDISELISGLMKLRSSGTDVAIDTVATYLGTKAILQTLTDVKEALCPEAGLDSMSLDSYTAGIPAWSFDGPHDDMPPDMPAEPDISQVPSSLAKVPSNDGVAKEVPTGKYQLGLRETTAMSDGNASARTNLTLI